MLRFEVVDGNLIEVHDEGEEIGQIYWFWDQTCRFSSGREFDLSVDVLEQIVAKMKELEKERA